MHSSSWNNWSDGFQAKKIFMGYQHRVILKTLLRVSYHLSDFYGSVYVHFVAWSNQLDVFSHLIVSAGGDISLVWDWRKLGRQQSPLWNFFSWKMRKSLETDLKKGICFSSNSTFLSYVVEANYNNFSLTVRNTGQDHWFVFLAPDQTLIICCRCTKYGMLCSSVLC